ncbi:MAG: TolC family protein, partial [Planctomycetes bacterium]|nr:TolC family protein [Planctomycetota bacterium]
MTDDGGNNALNFEVRVFAAQAQVIAARGMRDTGRTLLAELMAVPMAVLPDYVTLSPLAPESEAELSAQDDESVWVQSALDNHPGLQVARTELAVAAEGVRSARGQFYPEFSVTGSYGFDRISNVKYANEDQASALALEMNLPLYTGGFRTSQLARARAIQQEKDAQLRRQKLKVMSDVRQAIIALGDAQEQV